MTSVEHDHPTCSLLMIKFMSKTAAYRPCLYTLKRGFNKDSIRGNSYLPEQKRAWKQAVTAMIKIRFVFNGHEASGAPNENIVQNHLNI